IAGAAVVAGTCTVRADASVPTATTTPSSGITRTVLAQASPSNAPGQVLTLQRVRIAAGAKLAEHFHEGTQVASVRSGVLTYNIVSGTAAVTRSSGKSEQATGPKTIELRPGDSLVETAHLVHYGANRTKKPVVIELAALLAQGAPLATAVGAAATGDLMHF